MLCEFTLEVEDNWRNAKRKFRCCSCQSLIVAGALHRYVGGRDEMNAWVCVRDCISCVEKSLALEGEVGYPPVGGHLQQLLQEKARKGRQPNHEKKSVVPVAKPKTFRAEPLPRHRSQMPVKIGG